MRKAIFIDKDGTLIENVPYNVNPALIRLYKNAAEGLQLLKQQYIFVIISNQAGVAKGYFKENDLHTVYNTIQDLLKLFSVTITGFYYCPHDNIKNTCTCRKPQPGMLLQAARELQIDLQNSWMIGDILDDVEAGNRAGCNSLLVDNDNETEWYMSEIRKPISIVTDLVDAAKLILQYKTAHYEQLA